MHASGGLVGRVLHGCVRTFPGGVGRGGMKKREPGLAVVGTDCWVNEASLSFLILLLLTIIINTFHLHPLHHDGLHTRLLPHAAEEEPGRA